MERIKGMHQIGVPASPAPLERSMSGRQPQMAAPLASDKSRGTESTQKANPERHHGEPEQTEHESDAENVGHYQGSHLPALPTTIPQYIGSRSNCQHPIGPARVGKTMLAVGLVRASINAGYRTYYPSAGDLAARCHQAALEGRWATTMRFFDGPRLLVIDEVGYLPMAAETAAALFQVITQRYLKSSIVMTTNLGVSSWGKTFDDPMVAAAMLDRLLHRSVVFNITRESYRMRSHKARTEQLRKGVTKAKN